MTQGIKMGKIASSSLSSVGYDPETKTLAIRYCGGGLYHYQDVEPSVYNGMIGAKSVGQYLRSNILGKYKAKKL